MLLVLAFPIFLKIHLELFILAQKTSILPKQYEFFYVSRWIDDVTPATKVQAHFKNFLKNARKSLYFGSFHLDFILAF